MERKSCAELLQLALIGKEERTSPELSGRGIFRSQCLRIYAAGTSDPVLAPVLLVFATRHGLCSEWHEPSSHTSSLSCTLQLKSVIRRTKETSNVHPMYREGLLRRKMGPIIVNKSNSQDRLIEELQGKLGIGRIERRRKQQPDDWLTEGVIVMSNPQRTREEGAPPSVDKVEMDSKSCRCYSGTLMA